MTEGVPPVSDAERLAATPGAEALDINVAHPARVYDAWLGGKDHFAADRQAAEQVVRTNPGIMPSVRANRGFLVRVVRHLVREAGVHQFLDLGTGLPSANNVHEVAQAADPGARVVYVDNDPIVLVHARALLTGTPGTVSYIDADIRDAETILDKARDTLDFSKPIAVMLLMTLQFVPDADDPHALVKKFMAAVPSGSYLVVSCPDGGRERPRRTGDAGDGPLQPDGRHADDPPQSCRDPALHGGRRDRRAGSRAHVSLASGPRGGAGGEVLAGDRGRRPQALRALPIRSGAAASTAAAAAPVPRG